MLSFDMPYKIEDSKAKTTDIYVIAGGPCSGKTSILKGQLISECLFDFFKIFQKTNEKFDKYLPQNLKSGQIIK